MDFILYFSQVTLINCLKLLAVKIRQIFTLAYDLPGDRSKREHFIFRLFRD